MSVNEINDPVCTAANTRHNKDRVQNVRKSAPDSTRRAFLAVIAAVRRDFPEDFRRLLKEAVDTHA